MRPPRHGAANCERGQSFATAPALRRVLNLLKGKDCHVTLRCNFSNYCDHSRNIGLWRNRGNVCVDRPCPVRYISRAVSDFADIQGKAICLARPRLRPSRCEASMSRWGQRRLRQAASLLRDRNFVKGPGQSPARGEQAAFVFFIGGASSTTSR
jgi:hypothetical protein